LVQIIFKYTFDISMRPFIMKQKNAASWLVVCLLSVILFSGNYAKAQEFQATPVEISKDKVVIGGELYYLHTVLKGQTLYSISKTYQVPIEEIIHENPAAAATLQADQVLKIPVVEEQEKPGRVYDDDDYYYHLVRPGQTLFFLATRYSVKVDEIIDHNPGSEKRIRIGSILKIPKNEFNYTSENFFEEDQYYYYHKVKWLETIFGLSKKFEVSEQDILKANIELTDGLKTGQVIRIPKNRFFMDDTVVYHAQTDSVDYKKGDFIFTTMPEFNRLICDSIGKTQKTDDTISFAVLLPFYSDYIYSMDKRMQEVREEESEEDAQSKYRLSFKSAFFIEFYHGVLLAVDELKQSGKHVNLYVFDTERDTAVVEKLKDKLDVIDLDFIIGPAYQNTYNVLAGYAAERELPIVSPFSSTTAIDSNQYVYQVMPADTVQLKSFSRYINGTLGSSRIILLCDNDTLHLQETQYVKEQLKAIYKPDTNVINDTFSVEIMSLGMESILDIADTLKPGKLNEIVVFSTDMAYVNQVVSQFNTLSDEFPIRAYGMPEWRRDQNIDLDFIHNIELGLFSPFVFNIEDKQTMALLHKFKDAYGYIPEQITGKGYTFGLLGYDVTQYFAGLIYNYRDDCIECTQYYHPEALLFAPSFKPVNDDGGFMNHSISFIRYNKNFEIVTFVISKR